MKKIGKISLSLTAVAIISLSMAMGIFFPWGNLQALGQGESHSMGNINEERSYDLDGIKDLDISVSSAEIRISVGNTNKLRVHLYGSASGKDPFLDDKKSGSSLNIAVIHKSFLGFSNLKLDIEIPEGYHHNLNINNSSGNIFLPNLELEDLQVDMSSGNLNIESLISRNFSFHSSSGGMKAKKMESSKTNLNLSSGSVIIERFTGDLDAKLSSGHLEVMYTDFNNRISAGISSGNISISLPADANFNLEADTSSGKIICDFPITISGEQTRGTLEGTVGSSENRILLESSSGNISILKN